MPNWSGSTRAARLPSNWRYVIRPRILKRDGYKCQWVRNDTGLPCGLEANQVDHIHAGDDHRDSNLQALCAWHHKVKSSSEGGSAAAKKLAAQRATKRHPGLIYDD